MSNPTLRIATATDRRREQELDRISGTAEPRSVSIPLRTIVPLLIDAVENNRVWLHDFSEDLIRIDADLYEVLLAYDDLSRRAAA
jgi:hypothetical protein